MAKAGYDHFMHLCHNLNATSVTSIHIYLFFALSLAKIVYAIATLTRSIVASREQGGDSNQSDGINISRLKITHNINKKIIIVLMTYSSSVFT